MVIWQLVCVYVCLGLFMEYCVQYATEKHSKCGRHKCMHNFVELNKPQNP